MRPAELTRHWQRRTDWPDRDPPGHLYMGRAVLRLGRTIYPGVWTDADMVLAGDAAKARYIDVRNKLVGWMLDGSLPFATRNHRGSHELTDPLIWASSDATDYADLCRIGRFGGWETYYQPVDVDLAAFERLLEAASRDTMAERARASIPLSADDNRSAWVKLPATLDEVFRRWEAVGSERPTKNAAAKTLSQMWAEIGNTGGTPDTFATYLRDLEDDRFKPPQR